jgi:hypothetical protein
MTSFVKTLKHSPDMPKLICPYPDCKMLFQHENRDELKNHLHVYHSSTIIQAVSNPCKNNQFCWQSPSHLMQLSEDSPSQEDDFFLFSDFILKVDDSNSFYTTVTTKPCGETMFIVFTLDVPSIGSLSKIKTFVNKNSYESPSVHCNLNSVPIEGLEQKISSTMFDLSPDCFKLSIYSKKTESQGLRVIIPHSFDFDPTFPILVKRNITGQTFLERRSSFKVTPPETPTPPSDKKIGGRDLRFDRYKNEKNSLVTP